ncbi:MAG: hypothetical protein K2Y21_03715 [Phycisphaerales bacterium]|nr:hypothetical protein [Phycisphaerales bacterium]
MSRWRSIREVRSSRGTVLVAAIVALVVLQLLVVAVSVAGARDQDLTVRRLEASRAYYAAEAVANMAMREVARNADEDGDGGIGTVFASVPSAAPAIGPAGASAVATTAVSNGVTTIYANSAAGVATRTVSARARRIAPVSATQAGVFAEMWSMTTAPTSLSSIPWGSAASWATVMPNVNLPSLGAVSRWPGGPSTRYGVRFKGNLTIPSAGTWSFRVTSDDGSDLWINGVRVVNNDGQHSSQAQTGSAVLAAGAVAFECRLFQNGGGSNLWLEWQGPGVASYTLVPASAFTCTPTTTIPPVAAATTISINGASGSPQAGVDGYSSASGSYGGGNVFTAGVPMSTNATAAGSWTVAGSSRVTVDGLVGPGASASSVIQVTAPAVMTGTNAALATRIGVMVQGFPLTLPGSSGAWSSNSDLTIAANTRYASLSAGGNATITVNGNVALIVDGDLSLTGSSQIELAANSSLDLYVGGNLTLNGSAKINALGANPKLVRIHMTNSASRDVTLGGSSKVHATVRSAFGRLVLGSGAGSDAELFGTFHGNAIVISQNARLHADLSVFPSPSGSGSGGSGPGAAVISAWTQTP